MKRPAVRIGNRELAAKLCALVQDQSDQLNESAADVRDACPAEEFEAYRDAVGVLMGTMLTEVLEPLWNQHTDLAPAWYGEMLASRAKDRTGD